MAESCARSVRPPDARPCPASRPAHVSPGTAASQGGPGEHAFVAGGPGSFLDLEAVSFAARIPSRLRTRGGATKHLLRRLLASRLGKDFVKRRKQGFTVPTHQWIRSQQPEALRAALLPDGIERWLDPARVGERVLRAPRGLELAWPVLAFAGWVRAFSPSA